MLVELDLSGSGPLRQGETCDGLVDFGVRHRWASHVSKHDADAGRSQAAAIPPFSTGDNLRRQGRAENEQRNDKFHGFGFLFSHRGR